LKHRVETAEIFNFSSKITMFSPLSFKFSVFSACSQFYYRNFCTDCVKFRPKQPLGLRALSAGPGWKHLEVKTGIKGLDP
jgi:hypothetical protein